MYRVIWHTVRHKHNTAQAAGEAPREEKGKYVAVYRRQPAGDWKIVV